MKVIDLLNKIAKGELPEDVVFFIGKEKMCGIDELEYKKMNRDLLNLRVEVIEEDKKIEKIKDINIDYCRDGKLYEHLTKEEIALDIQTIRHKLDEIIDKINEGD